MGVNADKATDKDENGQNDGTTLPFIQCEYRKIKLSGDVSHALKELFLAVDTRNQPRLTNNQ